MQRLIASAAALAILATPALAWACPVCFKATEQNRMAFLITTGFLTFFPLLLIGGLVWYLRRRALQRDADEAGELQQPPITPDSAAPDTGQA